MAKEITTLTYKDGTTLDIEFNHTATRHTYKVVTPGQYQGTKMGVTTPLGVIAKPSLVLWSAKMVCSYIEDNCEYDGVYKVSKEDLKIAKSHHTTYRDKRADEGTRAHDWIEQHIRGNDQPVDSDIKAKVEAFLRWEEKIKPTYLLDLMENPVYSRQYDYCGKPDIPAVVNGSYGIIDLKSGKPDAEYNSYQRKYTSKHRAYPEHFYQCAAYDIALEELNVQPANWAMILYLDHLDQGYFKTEDMDYYRDGWLRTLSLYKHRKILNEVNPYT